MNLELLRKVEKIILAEPKRFNMRDFGFRKPKSKGGPPCGTVACIAGWATIIANKIPRRAKAPMPTICRVDGMDKLGISNEEAQRLFYYENWPPQFVDYADNGTKKSARIAVKRIEHFIKTKGAE